MDKNIILKFGKHKGKTIEYVEKNDPSYIDWALKNAPNLLKNSTPVKEVKSDNLPGLSPNLNFLNEEPNEISLNYKKRNEG